MALFKIAKGNSENLSINRPTAQEGFCYLTTDDMKFYVDLATNNSLTNNRKPLNAFKTDILQSFTTNLTDIPGRWTVNIPGLTELKDGITIRVKLNTTFNINYNTLKVNNLSNTLVYYKYNQKLTSQIDRLSEILLIYRTNAAENSQTLDNISFGKSGWILDSAYSGSVLALENDKSKFLRSDKSWSNIIEGPLYAELFYGNLVGNSATATKLNHTPDDNTKFLRGDNVWTNTIKGSLYADMFHGNLAGNATSATLINTKNNIGAINQPVYIFGTGQIKPIAYTIDASILEGSGIAYYINNTTIGGKIPAWESWITDSTNGPKAKIQIGNQSYISDAIPAATTQISGIVTTTTQSFKGVKTFSDTTDSTAITNGSIVIQGGIGVAKQLTALRIGINGNNINYSLYTNGTSYFNNIINVHEDIKIDAKTKGLYLVDSGNNSYAAISDNGTNLWIGAASSNSTVHIGNLYLHGGKDSSGKYNEAVYLYLRASTDTTHTSYPIVHKGDTGSNTKFIYINSNGKTIAASETIGTKNKPIYINAGTFTVGDYELKATINSATQWGIAYYSTTTNLTSTAAGATNTALMGQGAAAPSFVSVNTTLTTSTNASTSNAQKLKVTVLGVASNEVALSIAATNLYGVTKLSSVSSTTEESLAATPKGVWAAINTLDASGTGSAAKTLTAITQTDGKLTTLTFSDINITKSQISDFAHTHGNITNNGTIGSAGAIRAVTLNSNNQIIASDLSVSSVTAETTTATTFVYSVTQSANGQITVKTRPLPTYNNYSLPLAANGTRGGVQIGYSESGNNYAVKLSNEKMYVTVPTSSVTLNGSSTTSASFYAPTSAGTSGYYLKSNGSGAPTWSSISIPSITLNGSSTSSPSFYAPTSAGTSGYYLKSNGSGAPSWVQLSVFSLPTNCFLWYGTPTTNVGGVNTSTFSTSVATKNSLNITQTVDESSGMCFNGDYIVMYSPCDSYSLRYFDEDNGNEIWYINGSGYSYFPRSYNAVWNDFAEYRQTNYIEYGRVYQENNDGIMTQSNARLISGCSIASDTFGSAMGETEKAKTPMAVAGRVLAYPYQNKEIYQAGMAVCSAPNGTVDIMTREEIINYPDCIIGYVSEIPQYTKWGSGNIEVNGRIWIKIK